MRVLQILTLAAAGMTVLLALLPETGHDQLWLLLAAQRMGMHLNPYGPTDFESNPPLAIWLSAVPAWLAGALHLPVGVVFKTVVLAVAAGSGWVSRRLVRRLLPDISGAQLWFLAFCFVTLFGAVPARDFGQRDHLLILLTLPYLLAAVLFIKGERTSMAVRGGLALVAAVGIALKPHQTVIPIAVEVTVLLLSRPRRARFLEPGVFVAVAAAYYVAIRAVASTYFSEVVPILRDTYWAFGRLSPGRLMLEAIELHVLLVGVLALGWRRRRDPLVVLLLAAGMAATVAYYVQGTGWYYQQLPAISLFGLALALELMPLRLPVARWLPMAAGGLTVLALGLATYFSDFHMTPQGIVQPQPVPDPAFFAGLAPGAAVATLTTTVDDTVPPTFRYRLVLAQRYPHLWMLPAILRNTSGPVPKHRISPARLAELTAMQRRFMVEDLQRWHPELILVERCQDPEVHCQVLEDRHDDLLAFFEEDPAFGRILARYHRTLSLGPYDGWVLQTDSH